MLNLLVIYYAR